MRRITDPPKLANKAAMTVFARLCSLKAKRVPMTTPSLAGDGQHWDIEMTYRGAARRLARYVSRSNAKVVDTTGNGP
jgi:hypothetical protein